jgi:transcriptional regulator with XRE-family HTH domain
MGSSSRPKPSRLPEKLLLIRTSLGLSQSEMLDRLGFSDQLFRSAISKYELGTREPPLPVLLSYAQVARVWIDVLVNDDLDLPPKLPSIPKSEGVRRKSALKQRRGS